jgi:hypothetical protein
MRGSGPRNDDTIKAIESRVKKNKERGKIEREKREEGRRHVVKRQLTIRQLIVTETRTNMVPASVGAAL